MKFSSPTPKKKTQKNKNNKLGLEIALGHCTYFEKFCYTFPKKHSSRILGWLLIKP